MQRKRLYLLLVFALLTCILLTACGSATTASSSSTTISTEPTQEPTATPSPTATPVPDGYMRNDSEGVRFLKWTEGSGGQLTGYWSTATLDQGKPLYENGSLSGSQSGNAISLTMKYSFVEVSATGALVDGVLTLQTPGTNGQIKTVVYKACSLSQYNQALASFKAKYRL